MLTLSTEAAPHLALAALDAACRARGLDGEELVIGDGDDPELLAERARVAGARVVALRVARLDELAAPALARASALLGVPVSVPPGALSPALLARIAGVFETAGGRLLLGHRTALDETQRTLAAIRAADAPSVLGLAWEIEPSTTDLSDASATLRACRELLGVVRLHGGGPEQRAQEGRGVGPLFVALAGSGYTGPIVLCPSTPMQLSRWATWLASKGSAGCGHAVDHKTIELDVRDVEPRHRLETILGAYQRLAPGATLQLTVDHDPVCMYYTLEATEPAHSFTFQIVDDGPEVWRADVSKR